MVPRRARGEVAQLVKRIGRVRDELAAEEFWVRVERVNDQLQELGDLGLELLLGPSIVDYCHKTKAR
jgi:hypothetical protein